MNLNDALAVPMADIFNTTAEPVELYGRSLRVSLQYAAAAASQARRAW